MFGLSKREQQWKAEQKAMETAFDFAAKILLKERELKMCQQRIFELEKENAALKIQLTKGNNL